jgi:hypothetical protein
VGRNGQGWRPLSRHFERDPIPYALETDWDSNLCILEIGICQDSQPGGRDSNLRIPN